LLRKKKTAILIILLVMVFFSLGIHIPETTANNSTQLPKAWIRTDSLKAGLPSSIHPTIAFNITGDGNWTLIGGKDDGTFIGYYWNGSQWVEDASRVNGLGDVGYTATPAVAFNVTSDGNWTLISGNSTGQFIGYYWNGSQWVEDASRVNGLGDVGDRSAPCLAYNIRGDGNWTLIAGDNDANLYGYYWNGSQWISDSNLVSGVTKYSGDKHSTPTIGYNILEDNKWCMVVGSYYGYSYGYYWDSYQWVYSGRLSSNIFPYGNAFPCLIYNFTGDNSWCMIVGGDTTTAFKWTQVQSDVTTEVNRLMLASGEDEPRALAIEGNYLYAGTRTTPAKIVKIDLASYERVGSLTLAAGEDYTRERCMVIVGDNLYVGLDTSSSEAAKIVKIDLTTFTKADTLTFGSGENHIYAIEADDEGNYLYASIYGGKIAKIDLSSFSRVDTLDIPVASYALEYYDGYLYVGLGWADGQKARVQKVDLSTFTIVSTLEVSTATNYDVLSLSVPYDGFLYVGYENSYDTANYIAKVNLTTFTKVSQLSLGIYYPDKLVPSGNRLFYLFSASYGIGRINLDTFTVEDYYSAVSPDVIYDLVADPTRPNYLYGCAVSKPGTISKILDPPLVYMLSVVSEPEIEATFSVNSQTYTTPQIIYVFNGSNTLSVTDLFPERNGLKYAFTHWTVEASNPTNYYESTITLSITGDTTATIHYFLSTVRRPSEFVPSEEGVGYCLPLTFYLVMVAMFFVGLYLFSQRETWKISLPLVLMVFWLLIFKPRVPVSEMPIAILRLFTVPPWHLYWAIALSVIAVGLLLNKLRGK